MIPYYEFNLNNLIDKKFSIDIETAPDGSKYVENISGLAEQIFRNNLSDIKRKNMMNLNITNGSRTIWVSADGRHIPVKDLEIPHLFNIIERLHQKAIEQAIHINERVEYLTEYCPTFLALVNRAKKLKLGFTVLDRECRPTAQALAWVDNQRQLARETVAKQKVVKQLDFFTGNADNSLDALAELVAEKLNKSRKSVTAKRKR